MPDLFVLLDLFVTFFKIGLFTFGGGYAMIPLITDEVINKGWASRELIIDYIAIAESTPGPFALNTSTFIGMSQAGVLGVIAAALGLILPPFIVILIIAKFLMKFAEYRGVTAALAGISPAVIGLIASAALTIGLTAFKVNIDFDANILSFGLTEVIIFAAVFGLSQIKKLKIDSYKIILLAAALGVAFYGARDF